MFFQTCKYRSWNAINNSEYWHREIHNYIYNELLIYSDVHCWNYLKFHMTKITNIKNTNIKRNVITLMQVLHGTRNVSNSQQSIISIQDMYNKNSSVLLVFARESTGDRLKPILEVFGCERRVHIMMSTWLSLFLTLTNTFPYVYRFKV